MERRSWRTACADAKLGGDTITVTATDDGTYLDVTAVPEGTTLTGVVVKVGPAWPATCGQAVVAGQWSSSGSDLGGSGQAATARR